MNTLGARIRSLRVQNRLTQGELAKGICTSSMISQIESDRANPSNGILFAIADRLEVPMSTILDNIELHLEEKSKFTLANALVQAGEYRLALQHFQSLLDTNNATISTSDLMYQTAICYIHTSNYDQAILLLNRAMELSILRADTYRIIEVLLSLGDITSRQKSYPLAIHHTEQAFAEYKKLEPESPQLYSKILLQLAKFKRKIGIINEAAAHLQEVVAYYEQIGEIEQSAHLYLHLAQSHQENGDLGRSQQYAAQAFALFVQAGDWEAKTKAQVQWLLLTYHAENWRSKVRELIGIAVECERKGRLEQAGEVYASIAEVCLKFGEWEDAECYARLALQSLPEEHPSRGVAHRVMADVLFRGDERAGGEEQLRLAISIFTMHGMTGELEEATRYLIEHLNELGKYRTAYELLEHHYSYVVKQVNERGISL